MAIHKPDIVAMVVDEVVIVIDVDMLLFGLPQSVNYHIVWLFDIELVFQLPNLLKHIVELWSLMVRVRMRMRMLVMMIEHRMPVSMVVFDVVLE